MTGTTQIHTLLQKGDAIDPLAELSQKITNTQFIFSQKPTLYSNTLFLSSLTVAGIDAASTVLGFGGVLIAVSPALVALTVALPLFLGGAYFKMKAIQEQREDFSKNIKLANQIYTDNLKIEIANLISLRRRIYDTRLEKSTSDVNQFFNELFSIKKRILQQKTSYLTAGIPLPTIEDKDPLEILEIEINKIGSTYPFTDAQHSQLNELDKQQSPENPEKNESVFATIWKYTLPFLYMLGLAATFALLAGVTAGLFTTLTLTIIPVAVVVGAGIAGYIYKKIEERNSSLQEKNNLLERHNNEMLLLMEQAQSNRKRFYFGNDPVVIAQENLTRLQNEIMLESHISTLKNLKEKSSTSNAFSTGLFLSTLAVSGIDSASFVAGYGGGLISTSQFSVLLFVAAPLFILGCYFKNKEIQQTKQNYQDALIAAEENYLNQLKIELDNLVALRTCLKSSLSPVEINQIILKLERIETRLTIHENSLKDMGVNLKDEQKIFDTSNLIKKTIDSIYTTLGIIKAEKQKDDYHISLQKTSSESLGLTIWKYAVPSFYGLCTIATVFMVAGVTAALFSPPAVFFTIPGILASALIGYTYKKIEDRNANINNKISNIETHNHLMGKIMVQSKEDYNDIRHLEIGPHSALDEKKQSSLDDKKLAKPVTKPTHVAPDLSINTQPSKSRSPKL